MDSEAGTWVLVAYWEVIPGREAGSEAVRQRRRKPTMCPQVRWLGAI